MPGLRENLDAKIRLDVPETLEIDEELAGLIPPLTEDEYSRLEQSILDEGCRDAIVLWGNIIVDGHNRYKICNEHNIPFTTLPKEFADRNEVKLWMLQNQLSRRNLSDLARVEMVRKCEEAVRARARARQGTRTDLQDNIVVNLPRSSKARDELGKLAGVSGSTYEHATAVLDKAPEPVIEAARKKELSINAAYQVTKLPEEQQAEISARIEQGEPAKKVISEVQSREAPMSTPEPEEISQLELEGEKPAIVEASSQIILPPKEIVPAKLDTRPLGKVVDINIWDKSKYYDLVYAAPDWDNTKLKNEIYLFRLERIISGDCILLMWAKYKDIYLANFTAKQWRFHLNGASFLWINRQGDTDIVKSRVCLLWTRGDVRGINYEQQKIIEGPNNEGKFAPDGMRRLIDDVYGERDAIELYSMEPSTGWDVWMPD